MPNHALDYRTGIGCPEPSVSVCTIRASAGGKTFPFGRTRQQLRQAADADLKLWRHPCMTLLQTGRNAGIRGLSWK